MIKVKRYSGNPILEAYEKNNWEKEAVFNGCVVKDKEKYHLVYRATSSSQIYYGTNINLSSIGHAESADGVHFKDRELFIAPDYSWEKFGCEDPRVTKLDDKYYIFYTALSDYPHTAEGIKVGVAITSDFVQIQKKHQVTHFNSKAMALFPEKVQGKLTAILTVNTDRPPSKIAISYFESKEQIWSKEYWDKWLSCLDEYSIPLQRNLNDQVEVGAPPIKTKKGWLLIYSYIKDYKSPSPTFGIEAVLLDLEEPQEIIGRTQGPIIIPQKKYEIEGKVPNVVFPSGLVSEGKELKIYYGAADTSVCLAKVNLDELLDHMLTEGREPVKLKKFKWNPIITPIPTNAWESKFTFNPAAVYEGGKTHIVYRAMNDKDKSVFGYASSRDGEHIDERLPEPIYSSKEDTHRKINPIYHSCEDPRITKIGDRFYMCYTAYDGKTSTVVALTSIAVDDFLKHKWMNWETPRIISDPVRSDKNTCIFPEKIGGKYVFFHRLEHKIWIDFVDNLDFNQGRWLVGKPILLPRKGKWDSEKIGIAGPPIKTPEGWLLIYHGLSQEDDKYRLGAVLLDLKKPDKVLARLEYPILEPEEEYEEKGLRPGTVFSCGAVVIDGRLLVYYGAADQTVCVASCKFDALLDTLIFHKG